MIEKKDLFVTIDKKQFKLKVTLGFWKKCGFKRDEANVIESDPTALFTALKLAIFYGNKEEYAWENLKDMEKLITEDKLDSIDEDCAQKLSFAMIHYLPEKLRKIVMEKLQDTEKNIANIIDTAMDNADQVVSDSQKKN